MPKTNRLMQAVRKFVSLGSFAVLTPDLMARRVRTNPSGSPERFPVGTLFIMGHYRWAGVQYYIVSLRGHTRWHRLGRVPKGSLLSVCLALCSDRPAFRRQLRGCSNLAPTKVIRRRMKRG